MLQQEGSMSLVNLIVFVALLAVVVTLVLGLRSMGRGGEYDETHSEKFMWERVGLQALAVALLIAALLLMNA
jgi:predicted permease